MLYLLVKLMKLYTSCQINSFVKFKYQVYPKCVPIQCNDVNGKTLEIQNENGAYCLGKRLIDTNECPQWYYSCDVEQIYTRDGGEIFYWKTVPGHLVLTAGEPVTFELIPDADNFFIKIKEDGKCLELFDLGVLLCLSVQILRRVSFFFGQNHDFWNLNMNKDKSSELLAS